MDKYLNQLNKLSHKISKSTTNITNNNINVQNPNFDHSQTQNQSIQPPSSLAHYNQTPVYTINKNDFRDVVQKLTGSHAHDRLSMPPPPSPPPPSSRLHRFRPPPLAHISNRLHAMASLNPNPSMMTNTAAQSGFMPRSTAPLSPLPPFPTVTVAAESPVSAYLRNFDPNPKQPPPLVSSRWNNLTQPPVQQAPSQLQNQQFGAAPPGLEASSSQPPQFHSPPPPMSPLPFGCLNSPGSAQPFLSPRSFFLSSADQFGLPLSPTMPVPSPK